MAGTAARRRHGLAALTLFFLAVWTVS